MVTALLLSTPLACMSAGDLLWVLVLLVIGAFGILFFCYLPYRAAMKALAQGPLMGKPAALFLCALVGAVLLIGLACGGTTLLISTPAGWLVALLGLAGSIGWFVLLICYIVGRSRKKLSFAVAEATTPVPAFQVWFQDLLVALICYAAGLTAVAWAGDFDGNRADEFLPWAVYIFVAGTFGLLVAVDVARRSEACRRPLRRVLLFVAVFTLFPLTLPVALIAWGRWRKLLGTGAPVRQPVSS